MMTVTTVTEKTVLLSTCLYCCYRIWLQSLTTGLRAIPDEYSEDVEAGYNMLVLIASFSLLSCLFPSKITSHDNGYIRKQENGVVYLWILPLVITHQFVHSDSKQETSTMLIELTLESCQLVVSSLVCLVMITTGSGSISDRFQLCIWLLSSIPLLIIGPSNGMECIMVCFSSLLFTVCTSRIYKWFPGSFSFGEGVIVCQAISMFTLRCTTLVVGEVSRFRKGQASTFDDPCDFTIVAAVVTLLLPMLLYIILPMRWRSAQIFYILYSVAFLILLLVVTFSQRIQQLIVTILSDHVQMMILAFWSLIVVISLYLVVLYNQNDTPIDSTVRKYFHLLVILIFLPGLIFSPKLLKIASTGAFLLFLMTEFIRCEKLTELSGIVDRALSVFLDGQDSGFLILTHIYLLVGCALPLWLTPIAQLQDRDVWLYAGVLSLGVGDSFASIFGRWLGVYHWPGSAKTVEGTLAAWLAMTICSYMLLWPLALDETVGLTFKCLMISLLESTTTQVDNLVLPLYAYVILLVP